MVESYFIEDDIATIIILGFVIFGGIGLSWNILWYFLIFAIQFVVSIGVSLIVSSLTVYFRDLLHLLGVFMQLLFYATPIVQWMRYLQTLNGY